MLVSVTNSSLSVATNSSSAGEVEELDCVWVEGGRGWLVRRRGAAASWEVVEVRIWVFGVWGPISDGTRGMDGGSDGCGLRVARLAAMASPIG